MEAYSTHAGRLVAIFFLALLVLSTFPVSAVWASPDDCWTSKSRYKVGETVRIYFEVDSYDEYEYTIWKPDGSSLTYSLHTHGPGVYRVSNRAGYPTGDRYVELYDVDYDEVVAYCEFTVVGQTYTLTVTAKDSITRRPVSGADVYLDGDYECTTSRQGRCVIRDVEGGDHYVEIYHYDYPDYYADITVPPKSFTAYLGGTFYD